jgi:hypothetical protein
MPNTMLVKNADVLLTMDDARRELRNAGLLTLRMTNADSHHQRWDRRPHPRSAATTFESDA